jgi:hypothetical protein
MDVDASIINKIRNSGPILPIDVHKQIGLSVLFTAAHLNEMARSKRVKMTKMKKGASPFYYLAEKPEDLESLSKNLKPLEKEAFDLLKSKKVLRDSTQKPGVKICLKNLQDFATPLHVTFNSKKELFWKYYLMDDSEVSSLIKEIITPPKPKPVEKPKVVEKPKPVVKEAPKVAEKKPVPPKAEPVKKEPPKEVVKQVVKPIVKAEKPKVVEKPKLERQVRLPKPTIQEAKPVEPVAEEPSEPTLSERIDAEQDSFFVDVKNFFDGKQIVIKDYAVVKKESEIDFFVSIPSAIGSSEFFCRAKKKKRVNDGDLSTAFVTGQIKKLPVLFVSPGDLTKKAKAMIDKEFKNQVFFKKV